MQLLRNQKKNAVMEIDAQHSTFPDFLSLSLSLVPILRLRNLR